MHVALFRYSFTAGAGKVPAGGLNKLLQSIDDKLDELKSYRDSPAAQSSNIHIEKKLITYSDQVLTMDRNQRSLYEGMKLIYHGLRKTGGVPRDAEDLPGLLPLPRMSYDIGCVRVQLPADLKALLPIKSLPDLAAVHRMLEVDETRELLIKFLSQGVGSPGEDVVLTTQTILPLLFNRVELSKRLCYEGTPAAKLRQLKAAYLKTANNGEGAVAEGGAAGGAAAGGATAGGATTAEEQHQVEEEDEEGVGEEEEDEDEPVAATAEVGDDQGEMIIEPLQPWEINKKRYSLKKLDLGDRFQSVLKSK
jgi:hypothetical protein